MKRDSKLRIAGLLIGSGIIYFIIAIFMSEALYPRYSISANYISDLGVGPSAWLFNSSIVLLGAMLMLGAYLYAKGTRTKILSVLIAVTGAAAIGVGVFNEHFGAIHGIVSAIVFIFAGLSALYFAATEKSLIRYPSFVLGLADLSAMALFLSGVYVGLGPGGMERMIVYPALLWGVLFSGMLLAK